MFIDTYVWKVSEFVATGFCYKTLRYCNLARSVEPTTDTTQFYVFFGTSPFICTYGIRHLFEHLLKKKPTVRVETLSSKRDFN